MPRYTYNSAISSITSTTTLQTFYIEPRTLENFGKPLVRPCRILSLKYDILLEPDVNFEPDADSDIYWVLVVVRRGRSPQSLTIDLSIYPDETELLAFGQGRVLPENSNRNGTIVHQKGEAYTCDLNQGDAIYFISSGVLPTDYFIKHRVMLDMIVE
jgi:hypothetical protein